MMLLSFLVVIFVGSCLSSSLPEKRIVNGADADIGEFPYIVSLRREKYGIHVCGASIISPEWILTAAHCMTKRMSQLNIQHGKTEISMLGSNIVNVKKHIIHENYSFMNHSNDITLLQLAEPLHFDKFTQSIKLPKQGSHTPAGSKAKLIGWGRNVTGVGLGLEHLQKVDLTIISDEECSKKLSGRTYPANICVAVATNGPLKGQCTGDSGGPLTVDGVQVGVVSWSKKPCATNPGVFTEVSAYVDWIQKHTGLNL